MILDNLLMKVLTLKKMDMEHHLHRLMLFSVCCLGGRQAFDSDATLATVTTLQSLMDRGMGPGLGPRTPTQRAATTGPSVRPDPCQLE